MTLVAHLPPERVVVGAYVGAAGALRHCELLHRVMVRHGLDQVLHREDACRGKWVLQSPGTPSGLFGYRQQTGMHWKGGEVSAPPPPGRPAYAQPRSPWRQVPASMAFVTDSNRPPTALATSSNRLTA